jgi:hypothetical protein
MDQIDTRSFPQHSYLHHETEKEKKQESDDNRFFLNGWTGGGHVISVSSIFGSGLNLAE